MKVKVTNKFVDNAEGEVLRKVGDEFTVSKERFEEIERAGDFVKEVKETKEVKAKADPKK